MISALPIIMDTPMVAGEGNDPANAISKIIKQNIQADFRLRDIVHFYIKNSLARQKVQ